jgi:hypothetical protein
MGLSLAAVMVYQAGRDAGFDERTAYYTQVLNETLQKQQEKEREWNEQVRAVQAQALQEVEWVQQSAAAVSADADGLREELRAQRVRAERAAAAGSCTAETRRASVYADLLGQCTALVEGFAREADDSRVRGNACEGAYPR